jgi:hypothetical protein
MSLFMFLLSATLVQGRLFVPSELPCQAAMLFLPGGLTIAMHACMHVRTHAHTHTPTHL